MKKKELDIKTKALVVLECLCMYYGEDKITKEETDYEEFQSLVYKVSHGCLCEIGLNECKHPEWTKEIDKQYKRFKKMRYIE